jgi:protein SCO1
MTDVETLVAGVRAEPSRREALLPLLHEGHPAYDGLGESAALRARVWVMAAFETAGLPAEAKPAVLETLHTALDAFSVAAAARAARGDIAPETSLATALVAALLRMRGRDDSVSFSGLRQSWPDPAATTALTEVLTTLRVYGPAAHVVHDDLLEVQRQHSATWSPPVRRLLDAAIESTARAPLSLTEVTPSPYVAPVPGGSHAVGTVRLEDQDGRTTTFEEHFRGRRHVVAFFYTRCGNPEKCSATVTRLGDLATRLPKALPGRDVGVVGISYDPGYDTPARLRAYGTARGVPFSETVRLFRAPVGHAIIREHFDLNVGYVGTLVNQHGVELYLVGPDTRTERAWTRVKWTVEEVLEALPS